MEGARIRCGGALVANSVAAPQGRLCQTAVGVANSSTRSPKEWIDESLVDCVIGIAFLVLGSASLAGAKLPFKQSDEVAKVGNLSATVDHQKSAPEWLAIAGVVIGGVLVLGGALKRSLVRGTDCGLADAGDVEPSPGVRFPSLAQPLRAIAPMHARLGGGAVPECVGRSRGAASRR